MGNKLVGMGASVSAALTILFSVSGIYFFLNSIFLQNTFGDWWYSMVWRSTGFIALSLFSFISFMFIKSNFHEASLSPQFPFFSSKTLALTALFAALYAVFSFWSLFPMVGVQDRFIRGGVVFAPLVGILLGPWLGGFAVTVGGLLGLSLLQLGPFPPFSFLPHVATAFCAGLIVTKKKVASSLLYSVLLLAFAFYPAVGPAWIWPWFPWMQVAGLILLMMPTRFKIMDFSGEAGSPGIFALQVGLTCLVASLFGHVVGSLVFEAYYWPNLVSDVNWWREQWQRIMWLYPVERLLITLVATPVAVGLVKALERTPFRKRSQA